MNFIKKNYILLIKHKNQIGDDTIARIMSKHNYLKVGMKRKKMYDRTT